VIDHRSPPPQAEACLCHPYPSSQKGGTIIAEAVVDLETHERLLRNVGYRPASCPRCGERMHVHEYRERLMLGDVRVATEIAIFRCADRERCGAVVRVVPAFLARHLWRTWETVDGAVAPPPEAAQPDPVPVPERTVRRWRARLVASAAALVVVLGTASSTVPALARVIATSGLDGTRMQFVEAMSSEGAIGERRPLATAALLIHRLAPGVRLM
jgi:hypothetical protein